MTDEAIEVIVALRPIARRLSALEAAVAEKDARLARLEKAAERIAQWIDWLKTEVAHKERRGRR
jgi:hypothetical protein